MNCLRLYIGALLLFLVQTTLLAQNRGQLESMLVTAVEKYDSGDFKAASKLLDMLVDVAPDMDGAYYYLALTEYELGHVSEAEAALREAAKLDPKNYWYRDKLARLYSATGRDELAIDIYEGLMKDFPRKTDIYYNMVNLYAKQNRTDKVLETLDSIDAVMGKTESTALARYDILSRQDRGEEAFKALENYNRDFSSPQVLTVMGDARMMQYADTSALRYYQEALACDAEFAPAMLGAAEVYRQRRQHDEFFSTLDRFVSAESVDPQYKSNYLSTLFKYLDGHFFQNFRPQIDTLVEDCIRCHPTDSSVLGVTGGYYYGTNRHERAGELLGTAASLYPQSFSSTATYIQFLTYTQDWDRLLTEAEKAYANFPKEPGFLSTISAAHYNKGDYQAVIEDSYRLLRDFDRDSSVVLSAWSTIGDMEHQLGNSKLAYKAYDKALKVNRTYAPVLNNYAYYLSVEGRKLSKAYNMSKVTVEQEPDNATYLDTFGWILFLQKKPADAKVFFKRAMLYGGKESVTILDHYAEVLYALKEYDLAQVYWNLAKARNADGEIPDLEERIERRLKDIGR